MSSVWVKLYLGQDDDQHPRVFGIYDFSGNVDQLKEKVKEKTKPELDYIAAHGLDVYPQGTDVSNLVDVGEIDPGDPVPEGTESKNPLIVVAPHQEQPGKANLEQQILLEGMVYRYGSRNGVDPDLFRDRVAVGNIIRQVPENVQNWTDDAAVKRIQIHGPPASGKSSMMGKLIQLLKAKYPDTPIFFVRSGELNLRREEVVRALSGVPTCVVLLDDAQEWYDFPDFWALFKSSSRLLVFAATYSVEQFNPRTPVDVQFRETSNLLPQEIGPLLTSLGVDPCYHENMKMWFGNNYGRFHILVPALLQRWRQLKGRQPTTTLSDAFFRAETMEDFSGRFLPTLSAKMRKILIAEWRGQVNSADRKVLARHGVFDEDGKCWSCEYVRRKFFCDLFHSSPIDESMFADGLPPELDVLKAGLQKIKWEQLKQCAQSSQTGFPIEDVWQAEFYGSVGEFIPREFAFCKEYVAKTDNRVDFVLRNGSTRAIEFLIKSNDVAGHHKRFEDRTYKSLRLSGSYLVVDIKPWDDEPDLHDVSDQSRLDVAAKCFEALPVARQIKHALFLVANDLSSGILYSYDIATGYVEERLRSPPDMED